MSFLETHRSPTEAAIQVPPQLKASGYPETRVGVFDSCVATGTEPLRFGSADAQRACSESWPDVTKDLGLFTQKDPITDTGAL